MKVFKLFVVVFSFLALLGGCSKNETNVEQGLKEQILHLGNGTEPQGLDPHLVTGVPEHRLIAALFEGLVDEGPTDLSPVPGVAKSWDISEDQKVYTFHLNENAKWSNGDTVTANDFVYSWRRMLTPSVAAQYAYMLHYIENAEAYNKGELKDFSQVGVKALDKHTLEVTLSNPTPFFLRVLQHYSYFPVHQKTIEKFGKMDDRSNQWTRPGNMVSNGAFTLESWELNKIITVKKSPIYWDADTVKLKEIHFYPTESQQTEERGFRAGQFHITYEVPVNKIPRYQKEHADLIRIDPYLGTYYYRFNTTKAPFDNILVRKAFAMSIDRDLITKAVTKGGELAAYSFTPPGTAGFTAEAKVAFNPGAARQLLANAGYPNGKNFPTVEILYNTHEKHKVVAEAIQQMWKKELGVNVSLINQDWKVYLNSERSLDYDISRAGWIGDYPDPNNFLNMFITDGGNNKTGWSHAEYDNLIAAASNTGDQSKRFEYFQKAEAILMDELPIMPIYTYTKPFLISPDVKGWHATILDHHPYKHVHLANN